MHCAEITSERQTRYLHFASTKCGPPFKFEYLTGGLFSQSQYSTISLKLFSLVAVILDAAVEIRGITTAGATVGEAIN